MHPDSDVGGHDGLNPPTCNTCRNQPDPNEDVWADRVSRSSVKQDARMIEKAVKQRWPIGAEKRRRYMEMLDQIIENCTDRRERTNAIKAMVELDKLNLADEQFDDKQRRLDGGQPTDRIALDPVARQAEIDAAIARIGKAVGTD